MRKFGNREGHAIPSHFKVKSGSAFPYPGRFGFWTLKKILQKQEAICTGVRWCEFQLLTQQKIWSPSAWSMDTIMMFETIMPTSLDPS